MIELTPEQAARVERAMKMEKLLGGDPVQEHKILTFIYAKWKAKNLLQIPAEKADKIIAKPLSFLLAVNEHNT